MLESVQKIDASPARARSRITNGKRLHIRPTDARTHEGRRFNDLVRQLTEDLGTPWADLTEELRQLVRRAATLAVTCEDLEARLASGERIDPDHYARLAQQQRLTFQELRMLANAQDALPVSLPEIRDRA